MKDDGDFKVVDRRKVREDGAAGAQPGDTPRADKAGSGAGAPQPEADKAGSGAGAPQPEADKPRGDPDRKPEPRAGDAGAADEREQMVPADFTTLVVSLATGALLALGEIPDPDGKEPRPSKAMARYNIDTLAMLQSKAKGNLTPDEEKILGRFLYDLRIKFVNKFGA
jgi:hypothetical protein